MTGTGRCTESGRAIKPAMSSHKGLSLADTQNSRRRFVMLPFLGEWLPFLMCLCLENYAQRICWQKVLQAGDQFLVSKTNLLAIWESGQKKQKTAKALITFGHGHPCCWMPVGIGSGMEPKLSDVWFYSTPATGSTMISDFSSSAYDATQSNPHTELLTA